MLNNYGLSFSGFICRRAIFQEYITIATSRVFPAELGKIFPSSAGNARDVVNYMYYVLMDDG